MTDLALALLRVNLAAAAAVLLVLALRRPVRAGFGAEIAYCLWLAPLLAAAASLLPARSLVFAQAGAPFAPPVALSDPVAALLVADGRAGLVVAVWLAGMAATAGLMTWAQMRFLRGARLGLEGPALVGVVSPRLVVPADYERRYTADERGIIRAHERMHMDRDDNLANALIAVLQVLGWFNPLVHAAARCARADQELACDAGVIARHPGLRRRYAETLLKTQLAPAALPLGCYWPAPALHPLEERITALRQGTPQVRRHLAGAAAVLLVTLGAGAGSWLAKPVNWIAPTLERPLLGPKPNMLFMIYRDGRA